MNNIVNIQGYTLHRHNNELMVEDLELASRSGYERPHDVRKLIARMLERGQIKSDGVFAKTSKPIGGRRPWTTHYLNEAHR